MILSAHGLDLVEWTGQMIAPSRFDTHFATASWMAAGGITFLAFAAMYFLARLRNPACYLAMAAAILSHLLLDSRFWRIWTADLYQYKPFREFPLPLREYITAEIWLYGLLWLLILLLRTAQRAGTHRIVKSAAIALAVLCMAAAATRTPEFWVPVYGLILFLVLWVRRKRLSTRAWWNVPVLLPLLSLVIVEIVVARLDKQGDELRRSGDWANAVELFRRADRLPSRQPVGWRKVHLGQCLAELGDLASAEAEYLKGAAMFDEPNWANYWLARFYIERDHASRFYRPDKAAALFSSLIASKKCDPELAQWCKGYLDKTAASAKTP
jgi:tetratricopeptide (TPR) repeat protein